LIGKWQGYFIDGREFGRERASGSKWPINVIMTFQNGNQFTGKGQDEIGPFIFTNGKISGKCHTKYTDKVLPTSNDWFYVNTTPLLQEFVHF